MFTRPLLAVFLLLLANGGIPFARAQAAKTQATLPALRGSGIRRTVIPAKAGIHLASVQAPAQAAASPQPTATVSDPAAIALASRALQAIAGGTALSDITLQASVIYIAGSDEETGTATLMARGNAQSLVTLNLTGGQRQEIRNGVAGVWSGPDGTPHAMAAHNCWTDASWFFPALALQALSVDPTLVVSYLGLGEWNGAAAIHLQLSRLVPGQTAEMTAEIQQLSLVELYLDPASYLPLAVAFKTHPDDDLNVDLPVEIRFGGYRNASGILLPFRIQKYLQGTLTLDLTITNVAVNSGVSASVFTLPYVSAGGAQ
jgi:hypothetical protein